MWGEAEVNRLEQQSYEVLSRFRVRENGHDVHYYEVKFEDGTTDIMPGFFANAIRDEDEPCIQCGNKPRKRGRKICQNCMDIEIWGENAFIERDEENEIKSIRGYIDKIGEEVFLERSCRAKRIVITIRPMAKVRVAVPKDEKFSVACRFAMENHSYITNYLKYYRESKAKHIYKKPEEKELPSINRRIRERVSHLAKLHGFQYNKLTLKSMYTRWGSCSKKNNISLNILMYQLSEEIQDYLILHELMHTKIRNHGNDYWQALDKITGGSRKLDKKLKYDYLLYKE